MSKDLNLEELTGIISGIVIEKLKNASIIPINNFSAASGDEKKSSQSAVKGSIQKNSVSCKNDGNSNSYQLLNKKVIVEEDVKAAIKKNCGTIEINSKAIITPAAKDMILNKKLRLIKK
ncbi:MAG TPA: hypothetical protein PKY81_16490 [bacterium]|nr:hypothetical protein [bacterium]